MLRLAQLLAEIYYCNLDKTVLHLLLLIVSYFSDRRSFYLARKQVRREKTMNNQHQQNLGSLFTDVSYQVVSEICKHDHHYYIIHLKEDQEKNYLKELKKSFVEVDQFEVNGQYFIILDVSGQIKSSAQEIAQLLSERELQIATLVALGQANKQIAHRLHISEWTVATYLRRIFAKLGVDSRAAMVYRCAALIQLLQSDFDVQELATI
jgi:ATP/maltotriose-dependent transcriptional regulator MalT